MSTKDKLPTPACAGIGELLWDMLPDGRKLGGAPVNGAAHLAQLGFPSAAVSGVGDDADGREVLVRLKNMGVIDSYVKTVPNLPTGIVDVEVDAKGVPKFTIRAPSAWDAIPFDEEVANLAATVKAVVFGSLAQRDARSRATIQRFLGSVRPDCLKVFDVNLRPPFIDAEIIRESLEKSDILKLNDLELPVLSKMFELAGDETARLKKLREKFDLDMIVLTCGDKGSRIITNDADDMHKGYPAKVVDTVGAGDSFTAAIIAGRLRGMELKRMHDLASRLASFVCTQSGAVPKLPAELINAFNSSK